MIAFGIACAIAGAFVGFLVASYSGRERDPIDEMARRDRMPRVLR